MKTNIRNKEISTGNPLFVDLSKIIEKKHWDLLRVTNSELITLFWKLGKELNQFLGKNIGTKYGKSVIHTMSTQLDASYGSYFTERNLKKMKQFAHQFPDFSSILQIIPFVSWEQILLLLRIKNLEANLLYTRFTTAQEIIVNYLRKQTPANLYKHPKALKVRKDKSTIRIRNSDSARINNQKLLQIFQSGLEHAINNNSAIKNVFKEPLLSFFRPLMDTSKKPVMAIKKNKDAHSIEEKLIEVLSQHIEKYRCRQNRWLNAQLNLSFWEIGKRINQEFLLNNESLYRKSVIHNVSVQLRKIYSKNFREKELDEMAKFAEEVADLSIALRITYLVSWEYILALLPLREIEEKLFYVRLTATQGLSIVGLQNQIARKAYEQTSGAKEREQTTIAALQNPINMTSKKKKGNNTFIETTTFIDIEDSLGITNIFKNPYLPLLTTTPTKISDKKIIGRKTNNKIK